MLDTNTMTQAEKATRSEWVARHFAPAGEAPFSFDYGGKPWADMRPSWHVEHYTRAVDDQRLEHMLTYRDPTTALELRCVAVEYLDFPIVEWTLYFKNAGASATPILADIQALDIRLRHPAKGGFRLHHHVGSPCKPYDYMPIETALQPKADVTITTSGGRPSNSDFPYFNLAGPDQGVILVIGWPGQWAARFTHDEGDGLRARWHGADALQTAARRASPLAAHRPAILAGGALALAKRLQALDARPQPPPARRPAPFAPFGRM